MHQPILRADKYIFRILNVYVIKGIAEDVPLETIFKGIFPFLAALIVMVIILICFPQIATLLPGLTTY